MVKLKDWLWNWYKDRLHWLGLMTTEETLAALEQHTRIMRSIEHNITARLDERAKRLEEHERQLDTRYTELERAASITTVALSDVMTEMALYRRGMGDWVPQVDWDVKYTPGMEEEDE